MANLISTVFKSKKSKIIGAAVIVAAVAGGSALYINTQNAKIPAVTLTTVSKGELTKSVTITGDIKASTRNVISLSPTSKVVDVLVKEGQSVKKGDILAVLDTGDYKNQLKQQQINLTSAKSTLAYMTGASSSADKTSTGNSVSQAQIALDNANSNYTAAQNNLDSIQEIDDNAVSLAQIALDNANSNYDAAVRNLGTVKDLNDNLVKQARIAVDNAQNAYNIAKVNYDVAKPLYLGPPVNEAYKSQYDTAKQAFDIAENALKSAKVSLSNAETTANSNVSAAEKAVSDTDNAVQSAEISLSNAESKVDSDYTAAEKTVSDAANAVKSAEIALSNAKNTASFTSSTDSEKISNQKTQISLLNANIENFNNKIEEANLRANVDGIVTKMAAVANQYPAAGDEIVVDGTVQYVVDLQASQYDGVTIRAGQKVNVTLKGISKKYEGTVSEIGQLAEKSLTSTDQDPKVDIKVSITNPDENVKVGYEADAEIIIDDKTDALQLGFEAIQIEAGTGKKYVYAVDSSNKVRKTYIETGIETDYNIEVLSGLTEGQKCISNPAKTITDGMKVKEAGGKS
jgi:multidrug efflux pump subunit AcrA (membrane-fusion protein)